jgi:hypothetical protein
MHSGAVRSLRAADVDRRHEARECLKSIPGTQAGMQPLYLARIADFGRGDLVKVDCAACDHVALLTPALLKLGDPLPQEVECCHGRNVLFARDRCSVAAFLEGWGQPPSEIIFTFKLNNYQMS